MTVISGFTKLRILGAQCPRFSSPLFVIGSGMIPCGRCTFSLHGNRCSVDHRLLVHLHWIDSINFQILREKIKNREWDDDHNIVLVLVPVARVGLKSRPIKTSPVFLSWQYSPTDPKWLAKSRQLGWKWCSCAKHAGNLKETILTIVSFLSNTIKKTQQLDVSSWPKKKIT
jgi:hypothetical protein